MRARVLIAVLGFVLAVVFVGLLFFGIPVVGRVVRTALYRYPRRQPEAEKKFWDRSTISRLMRTVPSHEGFHFLRGAGDPSGMVATSLAEFVEKMRVVDVRSVNFHFKRRDFEKWIGDVIGDTELSGMISRIRKETHGENLRSEIIRIVEERLDELRRARATLFFLTAGSPLPGG